MVNVVIFREHSYAFRDETQMRITSTLYGTHGISVGLWRCGGYDDAYSLSSRDSQAFAPADGLSNPCAPSYANLSGNDHTHLHPIFPTARPIATQQTYYS